MSITLEVRTRTTSRWTLSTACLDQIDRLRHTDGRYAVDVVFGDAETHAGIARTVGGAVLLKAIRELLPLAKTLPPGFEVHVPHLFEGAFPIVGPGVGGALVGGRDHYIRCWEDHWTMQPTEELGKGKEAARHYEPADIQTENMGIIKVKAKKSRRSDLARLLHEIEKFVAADPRGEATITWG